jgi:hypothetical protein
MGSVDLAGECMDADAIARGDEASEVGLLNMWLDPPVDLFRRTPTKRSVVTAGIEASTPLMNTEMEVRA